MSCVKIGENVYFLNKLGEKIIDMSKYKKAIYFFGRDEMCRVAVD